MRAPLTYPDARAACIERFGPPAWQHSTEWRDDAWWPAPGVPDDGAMVDGVALTRGARGLHLRAGDAALATLYTLTTAGECADALDAAAAWMAVRREPAPSDGGGL
jgi:hypothetical protein